MAPFSPAQGSNTRRINVSSSSASVSLAGAGVTQVRVFNDGTATAWIAFGGSAVTANTTTSFPVGAGSCEVFTIEKADGPIYAAAIAVGSTGYIYFTPGSGI